MLIISRKVNEEIVLPEQNIVIKLLRIRGGRIVLGIAAPREANVERQSRAQELVAPAASSRGK
jgi:carbon storage regulator CsrA